MINHQTAWWHQQTREPEIFTHQEHERYQRITISQIPLRIKTLNRISADSLAFTRSQGVSYVRESITSLIFSGFAERGWNPDDDDDDDDEDDDDDGVLHGIFIGI